MLRSSRVCGAWLSLHPLPFSVQQIAATRRWFFPRGVLFSPHHPTKLQANIAHLLPQDTYCQGTKISVKQTLYGRPIANFPLQLSSLLRGVYQDTGMEINNMPCSHYSLLSGAHPPHRGRLAQVIRGTTTDQSHRSRLMPSIHGRCGEA